ncbi:CCA tRNA nucleotidyltransferase [Fusibacter sp. JL216-2]|uniref:CCA tRNA nucleotidyltransferase n=1 Tax=Fusibacter sp. JL216-2 TaxID=3071453 RepID=UPI003D32758D
MKYRKMENSEVLEKVIRNHPSLQQLFGIFDEIHQETGDRYFLVGGFVRDILLGETSTDIDIAVEGTIDKIIHKVNNQIDSEYIYYERFQTATLKLEDLKIDLITCRKESYDHDGALPIIVPGRFEDDIWRRDFTINAMAIEVSKKDEFILCCPKLAEDDLENGQIRILHDRSFYEDPTRIFRAIRYMCRLGFEMEANTQKQLIDAIENGAPSKVSSDRVFSEICRDLNEKAAYDILRAYQDWNLDQFIAPGLKLPLKLKDDLAMLDRLELRFIEDTENFDPCELRLLAVFHHNYNKAQAFIEKFHLSKRFSNMLMSMEKLSARIKAANSEIKNSQIYDAFLDIQDEVLLTLYVCTETMLVKNIIERYYTKLKNVINPVKGSDLLKVGVQPGPKVRELLNEVMNAHLDGIIENRDDAIEYVKSRVEEMQ